ncbi:RNA-guided endonuclease InsQ/TnpB family protein [Thermomonospora cellulosilytica]|uniref:IS605 OrfB family transposase n=1 Tax=Thermomonospora cellulosilytica TaxID=1411118 RepID=A0A7W3MVB4_9ACTN|nr:transposase [Thermomonospora cellulosilytica]MBA9002545.1 IS605 OrfB family transposase [Thermomonospora cellulosilytica]
MKLVVWVKLLPTPEQAAALAETLHACNSAAGFVSRVAFERKVFSRARLQELVYGEMKARGLSAQPALHVIRKVADAYTVLRAQIAAGLLGEPESPRRVKAEGKPVRFRPDAAQPFDDRCLSWQVDARTVSIWTVRGRMKNLAFTGEPSQLKTLAEHRQGESDLVYRDGKWLLAVTCEVPEAPLNTDPADWIGVDRGIVNLATTSDGDNHQGRGLKRYRRRMARVRAELQAKGTKSAKRKLRRRARREARHAAHINHTIAKTVVADAQRTGRGIALEILDGIRDRVRLRRHQRATHSSWPFHQLGEFIAYKARRVGVPVLEVDAAYTSQTCPRCGHVSRMNRPSRDAFCCVVCGLAGPADHIAAVNVRTRARTAWVFVNTPDAAVSPSYRRGQSRAANPPR